MTALSYVDQATDAGAGLPIGYTCTDRQGEKLGEVTGMIVNGGAQQPRYLVVTTGGWFSHKQYVIPIEQVSQQDDAERRLVFTDLTRDAVGDGRFPQYDDSWWQTHGQTTSTTAPAEAATGDQRLELHGERLRVGAEPYQAGTVRLSKHVVERQETLPVTLREECLRLEFSANDGTVRIGEQVLAAGETLDIPLFKERAVVHKEVVVREGVTVHKEAREHTEQVQGTVRQEELTVERGAEFVADTVESSRPPAPTGATAPPPQDAASSPRH